MVCEIFEGLRKGEFMNLLMVQEILTVLKQHEVIFIDNLYLRFFKIEKEEIHKRFNDFNLYECLEE